MSRLGVQWLYIVQNLPDDVWQRLCATAPVGGLTGVNITMDMNNPASGTPLPGSAQLGGAIGVLSRLLLLGPEPRRVDRQPGELGLVPGPVRVAGSLS